MQSRRLQVAPWALSLSVLARDNHDVSHVTVPTTSYHEGRGGRMKAYDSGAMTRGGR